MLIVLKTEVNMLRGQIAHQWEHPILHLMQTMGFMKTVIHPQSYDCRNSLHWERQGGKGLIRGGGGRGMGVIGGRRHDFTFSSWLSRLADSYNQ